MAGCDPFARLGFEIELLAPEGSSRAVLAEALAPPSTAATPVFHADTEPTLVPGRQVFHHLSRGFEVPDGEGGWRCRLVDDLTIVEDLDVATPPAPGWYRVLSDDRRLVSLAQRLCDPAATAATVLAPLASAFGSVVEARPDGRFRVDDRHGSTVAMAAPQPGMRERVAEVITPPLDADRHDLVGALDALLAPALEEGFTVPAEAAVHVHLDAEPFRSASAISAVVRCFGPDRREVAAEALARAYERWNRVGRMESPAGWVHRTAVNLVRRSWRRRQIERRALAKLGIREDAIVVFDSDDVVVAGHRPEAVTDLVGGLPPCAGTTPSGTRRSSPRASIATSKREACPRTRS